MATLSVEEEDGIDRQEGSSSLTRPVDAARRNAQGSVTPYDRAWQSSSLGGAEEASTSTKSRFHRERTPVRIDQTEAGQAYEESEVIANDYAEQPRLSYRLELSQQPTRGRTCGFGDADRRALSAPLIARLRVHQGSIEIVPEDIDTAFLVCAVDLWSADGLEDMNLVRHPAYHYTKATPVSGPSPLPVTASMAGEPPRTAGRISPSSLDSLLLDVPSTIARPGSSKSKRMFEVDDPPDPTDVQVQSPQVRRNSIRFSDMNEIAQMAVPSIPATYPPEPPPPLGVNTSPTNHTFAFQAPTHLQGLAHEQSEYASPAVPSRRSSQTSSALPMTAQSLPPWTASSSSGFPRPWTAYSNRPSTAATSVGLMPGGSLGPPGTSAGVRPPTASLGAQNTEYASVKNLVGALTVNGHILKVPGERDCGIFFVFHDLSVRTEGTFSIRLRLASIGSPSTGVHSGVMPVLCEAYTRPFEVMSAKKFPGMLDPTPLSQAFAKQGLRIPTRKGANRKKRRLLDPQDAAADEDVEDRSVPDEY